MMFDSWINNEGVATMELEGKLVHSVQSEERLCTFCDASAVLAVKFGALYVHLCEAHAEPKED